MSRSRGNGNVSGNDISGMGRNGNVTVPTKFPTSLSTYM